MDLHNSSDPKTMRIALHKPIHRQGNTSSPALASDNRLVDPLSDLPRLSDSPRRRWRSPAKPLHQQEQGDRTEKIALNRQQALSNVPIIRSNRIRRGRLKPSDATNSRRRGRFADDYILQSSALNDNQYVRLRLRSREFDTYLQVFDARTDQLILSNDDRLHGNRHTRNSHLLLTLQPGQTYRIRVTSYERKETGQYILSSRKITPQIQDFSFSYGYGLVDAAAAVANAIKAPPFAEVADGQDDTSWNLDQINAPEVWNQGITGKDVVVAVVDSGVDLKHPDLQQNLWRNSGEIAGNGIDDDGNGFIDDVAGWDFVEEDAHPDDRSQIGHGTHVAGIVAAAQNDIGITGVAPDAAIMPVRVLDKRGSGSSKAVAEGIRYAVRNGADVINLSLGNYAGTKIRRPLRQALRFAQENGVTVVIAAGNERELLGSSRSGEPAFWAATHNAGIAVGATDRNRTVADFSNPTGNRPVNTFVSAPGVDIDSLASSALRQAFGNFIEPLNLSGTSMSTPHVSGTIALMLSANPDLTPTQVAQILTNTANSQDVRAI